MPKETNKPKVGDIIAIELRLATVPVIRPLIVTSVNENGSLNGRLVIEPDDNPTNDGNFPTFQRNVPVPAPAA